MQDIEDLQSTAGIEVAPSPLKTRSQEFTGRVGRPAAAVDSWTARATARSDLRAAGWKTDDFSKPVVLVGLPYSNAIPCNNHLREVGDALVAELEALGCKTVIAGTPVISDGMTNGSPGMRYSLPSRDLIVDCIETMYEGYMCDAMIVLSGCDKVRGRILAVK